MRGQSRHSRWISLALFLLSLYIFIQLYAVPDNGKCSRMFDLSMLAEHGTILCSSTSIYTSVMESLINNDKNGQCRPLVLILGSYHKRGFVEIVDPSSSKDPSAFDKCYWLVYFSVHGFLKTIKDEGQCESTKINLEDTINKNSRGLKKKSKKKSIQTEILYIPFCETPDENFQRQNFLFFSLPPEFPSQVEDTVNKVSQIQRRVYLESFQNHLLFFSSTMKDTVFHNYFPDVHLTPPHLCLEEIIEDVINNPQQKYDHQEHDIHHLDVHYPIPPLLYNIDVMTDLLPFLTEQSPDTEHHGDCVNHPQPVRPRHYFEDQTLSTKSKNSFLLSDWGQSLQAPVIHQSCHLFHLSPPSSPHLPRHDLDTINKTPMKSPHQDYSPRVAHIIHCPPGDIPIQKSLRVNIILDPPQQALYIYVDDKYLLNPRIIKCVSGASISNFASCQRPPPPQDTVRSTIQSILSPPQSPLLPMRRESKVEDLFDQVRRHSRGVNFYR